MYIVEVLRDQGCQFASWNAHIAGFSPNTTLCRLRPCSDSRRMPSFKKRFRLRFRGNLAIWVLKYKTLNTLNSRACHTLLRYCDSYLRLGSKFMVEFGDWVGDPSLYSGNAIQYVFFFLGGKLTVGWSVSHPHPHIHARWWNLYYTFCRNMFGCCDRRSCAWPAYAILWDELRWLHV